MKKLKVYMVCIIGLLSLVISKGVTAQTVPTCESMGYTMTESSCNTNKKPFLRCPLDSTKVFCGLTACDLVTEKSCTGDFSCKTYYSTCPSKCSTCICTALPPSDWNSYNLISRPMDGTCGTNGYKSKSWCETTKYKCCTKLDTSQGCLAEMMPTPF